jgi:hypothetical protein
MRMENEPVVRSEPVDLWSEVYAARERINSGQLEIARALEEAWSTLERAGLTPKDARDLEKFSHQPPLAFAMFCVEMGYYPPPEVMLGLLNQWAGYLYDSYADGRFESAFLGPPKKRAGDFKSRRYAAVSQKWLLAELRKARSEAKCSMEKAAELVLARFPQKKMTVETLIRYAKKARAQSARQKK